MKTEPSDFSSMVAGSEPTLATVAKESTWPCRQAPSPLGKLNLLPHDHLRLPRKDQDE